MADSFGRMQYRLCQSNAKNKFRPFKNLSSQQSLMGNNIEFDYEFKVYVVNARNSYRQEYPRNRRNGNNR